MHKVCQHILSFKSWFSPKKHNPCIKHVYDQYSWQHADKASCLALVLEVCESIVYDGM